MEGPDDRKSHQNPLIKIIIYSTEQRSCCLDRLVSLWYYNVLKHSQATLQVIHWIWINTSYNPTSKIQNCPSKMCLLIFSFSLSFCVCLHPCDTNRHQWVWGEGCLSARVYEHTGQPQVSLSYWLPPHDQWKDVSRWEPPATFCVLPSPSPNCNMYCYNFEPFAVCTDVDECLEQNIQCGANRMCFNMRGSYQCIDTPCPPNYQRDPATG